MHQLMLIQIYFMSNAELMHSLFKVVILRRSLEVCVYFGLAGLRSLCF